jgi:hypothetical protein
MDMMSATGLQSRTPAGLLVMPDRSPGRRRTLDLPEFGQLVVFVLLVSLPLLLLDVAMRREKARRRRPRAPH